MQLKQTKQTILFMLLSFTSLWCTAIYAASAYSPDFSFDLFETHPLEIHAYLSAGAAVNDTMNVHDLLHTGIVTSPRFRGISNDVDFNSHTLGGIRILFPLSNSASIISEFVSRGSDDFDIDVNRFYLHVELSDAITLKTGRIRLPAFLFADVFDEAYEYPWIKAPAEVYDLIPIPNANGAMISLHTHFNGFDIQLTPLAASATPEFDFIHKKANVDARDILGIAASIHNALFYARSSYIRGRIDVDYPYYKLAAHYDMPLIPNIYGTEASVFDGAVNVNWHNLEIISEYAYREINGFLPDSEAWYVLLGYHFPHFFPNITYAKILTTDKAWRNVPNAANTVLLHTVFDTDQYSVEAGLRYDVTDAIAVKCSWQHMVPQHGTRGLFSLTPMDVVDIVNVAVQAVV